MFRVALGYPNEASLARNNLGFRIAEAILSARAEIALERFFLPSSRRGAARAQPPFAEDGPAVARALLGMRGVRTQPSGFALADCDLVLFSISFEGDAPHVPALLASGGLAPAWTDRRPRDPLVVAGGAAVMINPEPLARFFDLFLAGEAEALLAAFLDRWEALRDARRAELLAALDELPGALAPALRRHQLWSLANGRLGDGGQAALGALPGDSEGKEARPAGKGPRPPENARALKDALALVETVKWEGLAGGVVAARLPAETHFQESLLLELERGCPRRCRFCVASRIYAPLRTHDPGALAAYVEHEMRPGERIGLLGLSAGDYQHLDRLTEDLARCGWRLSISSLPADFRKKSVAARLVASGTTTVTIAPETGTDRLRALAGKRMRNETILETVEMLAEAGVRRLRTYFLIGLPFEEEADVRGIATLLAEMRRILPFGRSLSATVNPFVPKPRTPFQWAGMAPAARLEETARVLRREMPRGIELRVKSLREARFHAVLARADAGWGARIERLALEGAAPARQLRRERTSLEDWTAPIDPAAPLPWGYLIQSGERKELEREWRAAHEEAGSRKGPA